MVLGNILLISENKSKHDSQKATSRNEKKAARQSVRGRPASKERPVELPAGLCFIMVRGWGWGLSLSPAQDAASSLARAPLSG